MCGQKRLAIARQKSCCFTADPVQTIPILNVSRTFFQRMESNSTITTSLIRPTQISRRTLSFGLLNVVETSSKQSERLLGLDQFFLLGHYTVGCLPLNMRWLIRNP